MMLDQREEARDRLLAAIAKVLLQHPPEFYPKGAGALNDLRTALDAFNQIGARDDSQERTSGGVAATDEGKPAAAVVQFKSEGW